MSGQTKIKTLLDPQPSTQLPNFRRKAGAQKYREQQIFVSDNSTDLTTTKCSGTLSGEGVVVTSPSDISALVKLGSYGKGVFSRSIPCHGQPPSFMVSRKRERTNAASEEVPTGLTRAEQDMLRRMSEFEQSQERRMKLHAEWRKEADGKNNKEKSSPEARGGYDEEMSSEIATTADIPLTNPSQTASQTSLSVAITEAERESPELLSAEKQYRLFEERMELLNSSDPYRMPEHLQLSSEEALYLAQELNLLNVLTDVGDKILSHCELWAHFSTIHNFIARYKAYCYYRQKGWVPKSGLKFGVDFVLYKQGPMDFHSNYAVIVRMITEESESNEPTAQDAATTAKQVSKTGLTWRDVVAFDRVSKSVVKDLIICYVVTKEVREEEKMFPDCLKELNVKEMFVKRWEPEKERDS